MHNNLKKSISCIMCILILSYCVSAYAITHQRRESHFDRMTKAAHRGDGSAQLWLAERYFKQKNYLSAFKWYEMAARRGYVKAKLRLGDMYYHGWGTMQNPNNAFRWYNEAARNGNPEAQYKLGDMYYHGYGTMQSYIEAFKWFSTSAKNRNTEAQFNLGNMYYKGLGTEKNYNEAIRWYREASRHDHAGARQILQQLGESW